MATAYTTVPQVKGIDNDPNIAPVRSVTVNSNVGETMTMDVEAFVPQGCDMHAMTTNAAVVSIDWLREARLPSAAFPLWRFVTFMVAMLVVHGLLRVFV